MKEYLMIGRDVGIVVHAENAQEAVNNHIPKGVWLE